MASAIHKSTMRFISRGMHLERFQNPDEWVLNPDMSSVVSIPRRYWKWDDATNRPVEMSDPEKAVVDGQQSAADAISAREAIERFAMSGPTQAVLRAIGAVLASRRQLRTADDFVDSVMAELSGDVI